MKVVQKFIVQRDILRELFSMLLVRWHSNLCPYDLQLGCSNTELSNTRAGILAIKPGLCDRLILCEY